MDKKLRQQYNLPDFLTGKTPAEDHKILMKRFKDRKDPVSQRTMQSITEKLAQVQEGVKAQQNQGMMQEQAPMPEQGMPQGQVPQEQMPQQGAPDMGQMFAHGGKMNKYAHGGMQSPPTNAINNALANQPDIIDSDLDGSQMLDDAHIGLAKTLGYEGAMAQQNADLAKLKRAKISTRGGSPTHSAGMPGLTPVPEEFKGVRRNTKTGNAELFDKRTPYMYGGKTNKYSFGDYMDTLGAAGADQMISPGGIGQAAGLVSDGVGTIENFGKADKVDTSGNTSYDIDDYKKQKTKETALGAVKGVGQLGMGIATGNPMAIAQGAIGTIGAVGDIFGGGKKKAAKEMEKANFQHGQTQALNKTGISSFAYGGKVNKYEGGGIPPEEDRLAGILANVNANKSTTSTPGVPVDRFKQAANAFKLKAIPDSAKQLRIPGTVTGTSNTTTGKPSPVMPGQYATDGPSIFDYDKPSSNNYADAFKKYMTPTERESLVKETATSTGSTDTSNEGTVTEEGKKGSKAGKFLKNNAADLLSLGAKTLPLLKKHDKPNTAGATRVQKEYTPQQFDEKRFINEQRASDNSKEQIRNLSGGDPAAARAMAMSANRNKLFATSKGMQAADDLNRSEKAKQFDSQSRNEQINARMSEIYKDRKAKDDAAYSKAEYDRKSQIGDNVSEFAKELSDKQTVVNMTGYRGNATYVKQDGTEVEAMEVDGKFYGKDGKELKDGKKKINNGSNK